jgi:hypothetical protein
MPFKLLKVKKKKTFLKILLEDHKRITKNHKISFNFSTKQILLKAFLSIFSQLIGKFHSDKIEATEFSNRLAWPDSMKCLA